MSTTYTNVAKLPLKMSTTYEFKTCIAPTQKYVHYI